MNKTKLLTLLTTLLMAVTLTSCLDSDDDNTLMLAGHFTIEGTYPNYTLYHRMGYIVKLDPQSVNETTGGKGFLSKRAYFQIQYTQNDMQQSADGQVTISNAKVAAGSYVNIYDIMDRPTAEAQNLLQEDSLFAVTSLTDFWVQRGYMNIAITAQYSIANENGIYPAMNVSYSPEEMGENAVTLSLLYNRHTAKDVRGYEGSFVAAYPVSDLLRMVPGNDSVSVTLNLTGLSPRTFRVARQ